MDNTSLIRWGLNALELLACITGCIYWKKIRHSYWKWFPVYLGVIVAIELSAKYIREVLNNVNLNSRIYLFLGIPLQFLFFFWLFWKYYRNSKAGRWPLAAAGLYIVCWITDIIAYSKEQVRFFSFSYTAGNILLLILIITFFVRLVQTDEVLAFKSNMMFWVCLGLLLFYLGTFPFYGLRNTLRVNYPALFNVYWYIQFGLNYCMYISFILGFIWSRPK